ncbi:hypothetical protein BHE74_00028939 [Ensete ventricosum]|nr:hypothetical protein GW17_00009592 [Ensete ventricosum]RWW63860.1 hypothetical protein BHE74_00028939 [Ensete ventricosum]RZR84842.1 hypothetical protein BHM03_00011725 [Ensete ventricosum]
MSSWKFPCFKSPFLFSARRSRVKRVRKSLESSLLARIELIESYAKVVGNAESIAEQIQQIMEIENLEEASIFFSSNRWLLQAEANDEAERLLSSQTVTTELV